MPYFNQCGVDGLIVKKRPGRMAIINDKQAPQLAELIEQPQQAQNDPLAQLATNVFAALFARSQPHRAHLVDDESTLVQ